jgi:hypothetical protein
MSLEYDYLGHRWWDFVADVIKKVPDEVRDILRDSDYQGKVKLKGKIPDKLIDVVSIYLHENLSDLSEYIPELAIKHKRGDPATYKNGEYTSDLREYCGWYYWEEPEGQTYGMFPSPDDALAFGRHLRT